MSLSSFASPTNFSLRRKEATNWSQFTDSVSVIVGKKLLLLVCVDMMVKADSRRDSLIINKVFERVGVYGFGSNLKRCKYDDEDEDGHMELEQIGAERTKNVLILMSDTGGGHRASAEAIRDAFHLQYGDQYKVAL